VKRAPRAAAVRMPPPDALIRALMSDVDAGVLLLDPRGRVALLNPAAERLLGLRAARARGRDARALLRTALPGDDPVGDLARRARTERETVLLGEGGVEVPARLRGMRLGTSGWALFTLHDLTRARRLQEELRRKERLATLGQLAAGVAHEIRNPLAGIGTSAQVLLRRFEPRDDRARFVQVILDEVARLDRIVASLLQYARPRTPELRPAELGTCVDRVIELLAEPIAQARVAVERDVAARLGTLYIDADLVQQVLLNVSLNAVQAMEAGGTLRYEVRRVRRRAPPRGPGRRADDRGGAGRRGDGPAPRLEYQQIRVIDTGPGIPKGVLEKMFDPFFSTKPRGTGLGLAISQTIMQEHGGAIEVATREGRGTTVLLNFPVEKRHGQRRQPDPRGGRPHAAHR
jgi:two-component system, NtrC family, sensor histidine kinase HydH